MLVFPYLVGLYEGNNLPTYTYRLQLQLQRNVINWHMPSRSVMTNNQIKSNQCTDMDVVQFSCVAVCRCTISIYLLYIKSRSIDLSIDLSRRLIYAW